MATFHLINFGCRAAQADGAALKRQLLEAGFEEAASVDSSEVAVLNTCTVTATADAEVRQIIRRIRRSNPACRILVTGCYAQRAPEEIARLEGVAWVVGNSHKHAVVELLKNGLVANASPPVAGESQADTFHTASVHVGAIAAEFHFAPVFADDRTRPTLKVQDGCNARCSFCVIPEVRGRNRSLEPGTVIEQVRWLVDQGTKEIVLSGINLGSYGRDLTPRASFTGLLERILAETSIARVRISSIELMDVTDDLIRLAAFERRLAEQFHVPLQSGSDRILRRMNRRYWTRQYAERIEAIHESLPHCGLGADVMAGFPGETPEDHGATLRFIDSLPLNYLHVFPFSARPGTAAPSMPAQVEGRVAHIRCRELRTLGESKRRKFLASQVGRVLPALTLDAAIGGDPLALSTNYIRMALPGCALPPNSLLGALALRTGEGLLYGCAR